MAKAYSPFPSSREAVIGLASPKDRMSAAILDIVLLLPLFRLAQAPMKKGLTEAFLSGGDPNTQFYQQFSFILFVILFVSYHSLMVYWKGQTLGKIFFKIQVISYNGHLSFFQCLFRSITMVFEFCLLGYPLLALFSHPMRRPVHDRVADSLVIGLENPTGFPSVKERWRSHFASIVLLAFFVLLGVGYNSSKDESWLPSMVLDGKNHCQMMKQQKGSDLESVLQLYLSRQVDRSCLLDVARTSLWKRQNVGLSHLSLAFALGADGRRSNRYLNAICKEEPKGGLCAFSRWLSQLEKVDDQSLEKLDSIVHSFDLNDSLRVIAAGFFRKGGQFGKVAEVLAPIESNEALQPLVAGLLFHSLLGQKKWREAFWIYRSQASIDSKDILKFLKLEEKNHHLDKKQKLAMLELFFPELKGSSPIHRLPSSSRSLDSRLVNTYRLLSDNP